MWGYVFTNLLALYGALNGWLNPTTGVLVYYAFAVLRPTSLWFWNWDPYNQPRYSLAVGLSTLLGWGLGGFGDWSAIKRVIFPMSGLFLYLFSGIVAAMLCQTNTDVAWDALNTQLKIGVMAVVTITLIREERQIRALAWVIVASLGYLAYVFNIYFVVDHWNFIYLRGFGGIDNNGTAMIMVAGVPLAFLMGMYSPRWWVKGACLFATILMVHTILFSFSRGGQLGLCIMGALIFILAMSVLPNKILTIIVALIFVAVTLRLAGEEVRARFFTIFADPAQRDTSAASRFITWSAAWHSMLDHPLGVGPRSFANYAARYGLTEGKSVHNLFLQTGADYGFLGMIGLAMFYAGTIVQTLAMALSKTAKRLRWPRYFGHMVSISLIGTMTCSQFIGMESVEITYLVALLGLCTVVYVQTAQHTQPGGLGPADPEDALVGEVLPDESTAGLPTL